MGLYVKHHGNSLIVNSLGALKRKTEPSGYGYKSEVKIQVLSLHL